MKYVTPDLRWLVINVMCVSCVASIRPSQQENKGVAQFIYIHVSADYNEHNPSTITAAAVVVVVLLLLDTRLNPDI